jgi:hypothetical protein
MGDCHRLFVLLANSLLERFSCAVYTHFFFGLEEINLDEIARFSGTILSNIYFLSVDVHGLQQSLIRFPRVG